jgi:DNA repair exonuclease SbcCD nuclease subunit
MTSTERDAHGDLDELIAAHSSDLHLGTSSWAGHSEGLGALEEVVAAALAARAQVLLLAGDVFDHNRVAIEMLDDAARIMADAALPVVILPGNHDPATADSVYRRGHLANTPNVHVFGVTVDERLDLPDLDLEIAGKPHTGYDDMPPVHIPGERRRRRHIVMAHGHWVTGPHDAHRSWLMHDDDLAATGADYVALGHWDLAQRAGDGRVPAYYSGSPKYSGSVNLVRFNNGTVHVGRLPLRHGVPDHFPPVA